MACGNCGKRRTPPMPIKRPDPAVAAQPAPAEQKAPVRNVSVSEANNARQAARRTQTFTLTTPDRRTQTFGSRLEAEAARVRSGGTGTIA